MERNTDNCALPLGSKAPYFSLPGTDGRIYTISNFKDSKVLVVVFTCNHCPYAQAYEPRLCQIAETYSQQGVSFVAINANDAAGYPEEDMDHMKQRARKLGNPYPYLQDESQVAAKAYDAACTPECFVFDSNQILVYHGAVDDNHIDQNNVSNHFLRDAIDAALSGKVPETQLSSVIGCTIKWK
ncbi:MAG: thioredoxin family protein [Bdellovibrionales bacterium]|nr:thioredoxin family protein [Bdellovibrionales bacterium]